MSKAMNPAKTPIRIPGFALHYGANLFGSAVDSESKVFPLHAGLVGLAIEFALDWPIHRTFVHPKWSIGQILCMKVKS